MAAIQNIEVVVDIDISKAVAALTELQGELLDLAKTVEMVDAAARVEVDTSVESVSDDLAREASKIEAFKAAHGLENLSLVARGGGGGGRLAGMLAPGRRARTRALRRGGPLKSFAFNLKRAITEMDGFSLRMSTLHNLLAAFIPALVVLIAAVPTAVNAILGLATAAIGAAGALLAIGGLGALGAATEGGQMPSMEDFTEFMKDIRDSFFEAFLPLAERLEPVFLDALDGLERFFEAIAAQGDSLVALVDEVRAFGRFMTEFIPDVLGALAGAVEALAPAFARLGEFLHEDTQIIRTMTQLTLEALPALGAVAKIIVDALPGLVEFSTGMAMAAAVIFKLIGAVWGLFRSLGFTNKQLGFLIGTFLTSITIMALMSFFIKSRLAAAFLYLAKILFGRALIAMGVTTQSLWQMSFAALAAYSAVALLITALTLGAGAFLIGGAVSMLADEFFGLAEGVTEATGAMRDFDRVSQGTSSFNAYGNAPRPAETGSAFTGGGGTTVNIETTGDRNVDKSAANKGAWRMGRTSGKGA